MPPDALPTNSERASTPHGWAHKDDDTACFEPAWCTRAHVKTPQSEENTMAARYDWAEDPTAQDVIDALRLAVMAQDDPVKVDRLLRTLLEFAPETDSSRGIDLLLRLAAEATVKLEVAGDG